MSSAPANPSYRSGSADEARDTRDEHHHATKFLCLESEQRQAVFP